MINSRKRRIEIIQDTPKKKSEINTSRKKRKLTSNTQITKNDIANSQNNKCKYSNHPPGPNKKKLSKKRKENNNNIDEDEDDDDATYLPPENKKKKKTNTETTTDEPITRRSKRLCKIKENDNESNLPTGYRHLYWKEHNIETPKFVEINLTKNNFERSKSEPILNNIKLKPESLLLAELTTKEEKENDKILIEDTSNIQYFLRHFRAEKREKLFYQELLENREIKKENERRKKKRMQNNNDNDEDLVDLHLPLVKAPSSYKLDEKDNNVPVIPKYVTHRITFNYDHELNLKSSNPKQWKMPDEYIYRTDIQSNYNKIQNDNSKPLKVIEEMSEDDKKKLWSLIQKFKQKQKAGPVDVRTKWKNKN